MPSSSLSQIIAILIFIPWQIQMLIKHTKTALTYETIQICELNRMFKVKPLSSMPLLLVLKMGRKYQSTVIC